MPSVRAVLACLLVVAAPLTAQEWNSPAATALAHRAVARRLAVEADSGLRSYRTRAHGFVFFLAQVGQGFSEPPRLVKADELDVEVYWQAPGRSKQVILGWRDGTYLPTDITYHRDHLGIVTNNFGHLIRMGEGDEVRDAVHPLSPQGLGMYDFALRDSIRIRVQQSDLIVQEVAVRPKDPSRPLVIGVLYLDTSSAELVRFRFSFTRAAYRQDELEDITVVLENALHEGRFWLPFRQEIEIRRRSTWLDFPARGIIRGRWEIGPYDLNPELPASLWPGPAIAGRVAPLPPDSAYPWPEPLDQALRGVARPLTEQDMEAIRLEAERVIGEQAANRLAASRLSTRSLSDLVRVNRVQGLALGIGWTTRLLDKTVMLRPELGLGTSDGRVTGGLLLERGGFWLEGRREVRDVADYPVIAPVMNSILAQEAGDDYGDYYLRESVQAGLRHRVSPRTTLSVSAGLEDAGRLAVAATPARGTYRPNPNLDGPTYGTLRVSVDRSPGGFALDHDLSGALGFEAGEGPTSYARGAILGQWRQKGAIGLDGTEVLARIYAGWGTGTLPASRSFVLGGRGTLVGEPFRAYGGRSMAWGHLEWRIAVPVPAARLGTFASTGDRLILAPFLAAGWTDRAMAGTPWIETDGLRPVLGLAAEWFMRLVRLEAGFSLRDGGFGITLDIHRDWWPLL